MVHKKRKRKKIAHCVLGNLHYIIFIYIGLDKNFEFSHKIVQKSPNEAFAQPNITM